MHSPVVLIEYDAQSPLAYGENAQMGGGGGVPSGQPSGMPSGQPTGMPSGGPGGGGMGGGTPTQQHIHTIIRTPNSGDYGIDLLKLHLETDH